MAKARIRVVMDSAGARAILRSSEVRADLQARAEKIAAVAGPGMEPSSMVGPNRARASVITTTLEARLNEAKYRSLTKAIGGVGLVSYTNKAGKTRMVTQAQADNWGSRKK